MSGNVRRQHGRGPAPVLKTWRAPDGIPPGALSLRVSQPVSRVLDGTREIPACVTAIPLGRRLPGDSSNLPGRPGLDIDPEAQSRFRAKKASRRPYSVLLPVGFAVPPALPPARCALTAPFHPCRGFYATRRGGLFSVALSLGSRPPDVIRHRLSTEPGLSSPATPSLPSPACGGGKGGAAGAAVRPTDINRDGYVGLRRQEAPRSAKARARAAMFLGRPRWASSSSNVLRVDASLTPSTRCGRKWRWKADTTSWVTES